MTINLLYWTPIIVVLFFAGRFVFDVLLRGFLPFLPSRPWVVDQIMNELEVKKEDAVILAFSTGRSGLIHALEKRYPKARIIAIEPYLFAYWYSFFQASIRRTNIKVLHQKINRVDVRQADLIYSHLYPEDMEGLGPKLKFECKSGCQIISTGFNIVHLKPKKIIPLPDRKGRLDWLSKNQKLFQSKRKKHKKEKKAFYYEI